LPPETFLGLKIFPKCVCGRGFEGRGDKGEREREGSEEKKPPN